MSGQAETRPSDKPPRRRPYEAPRLARVGLKTDEVLGFGCKTLNYGSAPMALCVVTMCGTRDMS